MPCFGFYKNNKVTLPTKTAQQEDKTNIKG